MKSGQTPLHKVQGMGAAHTGTGHFWRERVTALALVPLSLWFLYAMLGMVGASVVTPAQFFQHPWNGALMAAFVSFSLYHAGLGLQVVIEDYVHTAGTKIFSLLAIRGALLACWIVSMFAILRIAVS
jgi:succinate dehydrogenase / fumarate reductase membrane anchor subunit